MNDGIARKVGCSLSRAVVAAFRGYSLPTRGCCPQLSAFPAHARPTVSWDRDIASDSLFRNLRLEGLKGDSGMLRSCLFSPVDLGHRESERRIFRLLHRTPIE
jgi:hypothetical protein